jgi:DNA mismatch repair protein MutS
MMRQYLAIKAQHPDCLLFYRMGDFYELFLADAELVAPILDIALTTRDKHKQGAVPMCGVPVHSAGPHIRKLAEQGHRVAICEQVEDARAAGGRRLVRREVIEVVTPGLVGDPDGIEASRECLIAALCAERDELGLALLDATTGDFRATAVAVADLRAGFPRSLATELERAQPREILFPEALREIAESALAKLALRAARTPLALAGPSVSLPASIEGLRPDSTTALDRAALLLAGYLARHQPFALAQIVRLRRYALDDAMVLDAATRAHLELFENSEDGGRRGTLFERIDRSETPLGARTLARWMAYPLLDPAAIRARQDAVAWLALRDRRRARLRVALRPVRDLERLLARAARPTASPRDLGQLRASLEALPAVAAELAAADDEGLAGIALPRPSELVAPIPVPEAAGLLRAALVDDPPVILRGSRGASDTGYIRAGWHAELDGLREAAEKGREWIAGLEARERERSGIAGLRVRFHPVHGYGLEVTKAQLARVPEHFERRQTLANAERFTTPELREMESKVLSATDRAAALERELFEGIRRSALEAAPAIRAAAQAVAQLDALCSLAEIAREADWVRPAVDESVDLSIRAGRHPVVEEWLRGRSGGFVPNDTELSPNAVQLLVLTGPNMSGKSTYLRQVALIVLLAQMGSCVPAESARIGVVDRVFTRVGASDRLARGESTFMVEMRETAEILACATARSLVILDEIGRGTSTYDGLSIAWAVAEFLHDAPGLSPRTLFATHYHELSDLASARPRVGNAHFAAREWGEEILFLRQLVAGGASRSYGIQVAKLAGLPSAVVERAREILSNLEGGEFDERGRPRFAHPGGGPALLGGANAAAAAAGSLRATGVPRTPAEGAERRRGRRTDGSDAAQLGLFGSAAADPREIEVLRRLRSLDWMRLSPLEALNALAQLKRQLEGESGE